MIPDAKLTQAARSLNEFTQRRTIPPAPIPPAPMARRPRRRPSDGQRLAFAVIVVSLVSLSLLAALYRERGETKVEAAGPADDILALDSTESWTYQATVLRGSAVDSFQVETSSIRAAQGSSTASVWPIALYEPWASPSACTDTRPVQLPPRSDLDEGGSAQQEVRATCDGVELVAVARISWSGAGVIEVPAGQFNTSRIDIEANGFQPPFPLDVSLWVDPDIGVVRIESIGGTGDSERHVLAELMEIEVNE